MASACAVAVPVSKLSKKLQKRHILVIGMNIMLVAFTLAATQNGLTPLMFACFIIAGAGYSVVIVNLYPYMLELSDPGKIGRATGIFNTVSTVAMVITPIASGALQDSVGRFILFPYCLAALMVSIVFFFFIKDKPAADDANAASNA